MSNGLNALPPKTAFFAGLAGGVLIILAIGFFVLLVGVVNDKSFSLGSDKDSAPQVARGGAAAPPTTPAPPGTREAGEAPQVTDTDHVRGNPDAAITMIEYSDFECPFCKRFHPTMQQVLEKYPNDVRWVYRHFPLSFHRPLALKAAEGSECAAELGGNDAFWLFTDAYYERTQSNGNGLQESELPKIAADIGLDRGAFETCLNSGKYAASVDEEMNAGAAAGVSGTPGTFVIGPDGESQLIPGALPFESVDQVIQSLL